MLRLAWLHCHWLLPAFLFLACPPQYGGPDRDLSRLQLNSADSIASVGHSSPSAAFDFVSNEPVFVLFKNELPLRHLNQDALDARRVNLHCGIGAPNCRPDVRTTVHFHGGHTHPQYGRSTGTNKAMQRRDHLHRGFVSGRAARPPYPPSSYILFLPVCVTWFCFFSSL